MKRIRIVPWVLAVLELLIPLIASGFTLVPFVVVWGALQGMVWLFGGTVVPTRTARIVVGLALLPVLFLAAFEGGWWLIPAGQPIRVTDVPQVAPRQRPRSGDRVVREVEVARDQVGDTHHRGLVLRDDPRERCLIAKGMISGEGRRRSARTARRGTPAAAAARRAHRRRWPSASGR